MDLQNFLPIINGHNELNKRRLQVAKKVIADAKSISDEKARSSQLKEAEKILSFIKDAYQDLESKYPEEFRVLRLLRLRK